MNWRNIVVPADSVLTSDGQVERIPRTLTIGETLGILDYLLPLVDPAPTIEELNDTTADAAANHALGARDYQD